jgi:hypothetical protein
MKFQKKSEELFKSLSRINLELKMAIQEMHKHNNLQVRALAFEIIGKLKQELFYYIYENSATYEKLNASNNLVRENVEIIKFYKAVNILRAELFDQELIFDNQIQLLTAYARVLDRLLKSDKIMQLTPVLYT